MRTAIGIDLGGTNTRVTVVDESGHLVDSLREKTPTHEGPDKVCETMAVMVNELKIKHPEVLGVGLGLPGPLNRRDKVIINMVNIPGFVNYPIGQKIEKLTGLRAFLDNDAKCACLGEGMFGASRGLRNYMLVTFGTGIGGGIVVDGRMMYGKADNACEVGHLTLHPEGRACNCGNRGCWEQYVSATAMGRRASEAFGRSCGAKELMEIYAAGDFTADKVLREIAQDISIGVASLVNLFDPEMIVFGGGVFVDGGGPLIPWVKEN
ncbi:MAG: ROK family protein, partial [Bdellovibrionales bacterium]|nr:ROK family protein [Bdellovibrionales bacterium]